MEEDVSGARGDRPSAGTSAVSRVCSSRTSIRKLRKDNRITYNRNMGFSGSRSPEVKRKRADLVIDTNKQNSVSSNKNSDVPSTLDTNLVDPQKIFRVNKSCSAFSNSRERLFAQMEQKTKEEQQRQKPAVRKLSPNRLRAVSPTSPISRSPVKHEHSRKLTHPLAGSSVDNLTKNHHDNREHEHFVQDHTFHTKPDYLRTRSTDTYKRAESLDRLDNDFTRRPP